MKKLSLQFFGLLLMSGVFVMSGCDGDEETGGDPRGPEIKMQSGGGLISDDETVVPEDTIKFAWIAQQADNPLEEFAVSRNGQELSGFPVELDASIRSFYRDTLTHVAPGEEGVYNYTFRIEDSEGFEASTSLALTVSTPGNPVDTNEGSLRSPVADSTSLTFIDANTGTEYEFGDVHDDGVIQGDIDFGFYTPDQSTATFAATSDFPSSEYDLSGWVQNNTTFRPTDLTPCEFDAIGYDEAVVSAATGATDTRINVETDDVVGFVTARGSHGLMKITDINFGDQNTTIEFVIKIQN